MHMRSENTRSDNRPPASCEPVNEVVEEYADRGKGRGGVGAENCQDRE